MRDIFGFCDFRSIPKRESAGSQLGLQRLTGKNGTAKQDPTRLMAKKPRFSFLSSTDVPRDSGTEGLMQIPGDVLAWRELGPTQSRVARLRQARGGAPQKFEALAFCDRGVPVFGGE
jgi:hypothetical protein